MIDPRELRIGNFIGMDLGVFHENYFRVLEVAFSAMMVTDQLNKKPETTHDYYDADDMEAIPLTSEWLERLNFRPDTKTAYLCNQEADYRSWQMRVVRHNDGDDKTYWFSSPHGIVVELKYVHQLQNLYFALTGKELTLQPNA